MTEIRKITGIVPTNKAAVEAAFAGIEPGSLKPIWPSSPTPIIIRSILRTEWSYEAQYSETLSSEMVPSGMWMFSGRMSMWLRKSSWMRKLRLCCSVERMG